MRNHRIKIGYLIVILSVLLTVGAYAQDAPATTDVFPAITGPLTLEDAIQTALKYNPMVQAAGSQASSAQARVGMAKAMSKPQVAASTFAGKSTMGDIITSPPNVMPSSIFSVPGRSAVTGQVGLMYPIYTGGRLLGVIRGAEALSTAAASDRASVEQNIALETKTAYHRALLAQATVGVYQDLVKEEEERVRIAEVSFREGRIAKYDLLRNQTGLAESRQQLANAERDSQVALVDLKAVMGVSQESDINLADQLAYAPITDTLDSYLVLAVGQRTELTAARSRASSAASNVDVAKSAYKPQVYVSAMQGVIASSRDTESGFTAGISVGIPLVDGGQRRASVKEAESMLQVMEQEEKQALLGVQQDVHTVWAEVQAAEKNVGLSEAAVEQADEDYRVIKLRYEAGKTVNVEVLDALASLVRAQNNRLMALYEHSIARDRLARAIGEI